MTKKEKKQLISTLRAAASENRDAIKTSKSLTAKLAYVLKKTDEELLLLDESVLQDHLQTVYTHVKGVNPAAVESKTDTTKATPKAATNAAQTKKTLKPKNKTNDSETEMPKILANMFPNTFVYELTDSETNAPKKVTMTKVTANITNMNDVIKIQDEAQGELYVAVYWPKEFLNNYETALDVPAPKNGFENSLDVCGIALITSSKSHIYAMSTETEGMYFIRNKELPLAKDKPYRVFTNTEYDFYVASEYVEPKKEATPKASTKKTTTPKVNIPADIPETDDETPKAKARGRKKLTPKDTTK